MNIHLKIISAITLVLSVQTQTHATEIDKQQLKKEAISIVKKFGGSLKPQLGKAMKTGGPVHAVKVCSVEAPAIASRLSKETGWDIRRVSLKARNSKTAMPDSWEAKVLKEFDRRQAAGESVKKMAYAEVVNGQFRFMKAQGVEPVCLACHASDIGAPIEAAIKKIYPNDMARGYSLGQVRGAFSLIKDL